MPRVSVIIPNYNYARYLRERIDSVLAQREKDMEVLLLDDGSSDDSIAVMQEYAKKDPRVQIIRNPQNSGSPFLQWEKGIALSSGEYIWIAEADDSAQPELLSTALQILMLESSDPSSITIISMSYNEDRSSIRRVS